jgi:hypothetical protein
MTTRSPRLNARVAGAFYLATIVTGVFAEAFVRGSLIVAGDAKATAANILASQPLYRLGLTADIVALGCYVVVTLLFYDLFKPVSRSLSMLAAFFSLVGTAVLAIDTLNLLAPLALLGGAPYLTAFSADQLRALAYTFLKLHALGYSIDVVFFGFYCLLIGYLVFKSTFLPRVVGLLLAIAGLGYLINSFATFLALPLPGHLSDYFLVPGMIGEGSLTLWLLIVGLDPTKWRQRAAAAPDNTQS